MTLPPIPEYLIPLLALIIPPIAGWLNDDRLPQWFNAIVSAVIVFVLALICAVITHSLTNDLVVSFMIVVAFAYALLLGPLAALHHWFVVHTPSPIGVFAPAKVDGSATTHMPTADPLQRRASLDDDPLNPYHH